MRTTRTRTTLLALALGAGLTLTACGGDDSTVDQPAAAETVNGISTAYNDADITFINDMTPHHSGAVAMAELAPDRAQSPEVKDLASRILDAQQPELTTMEDMAEAWGVELAANGGGGHGGHGGGGMDMDADTAALEPLSGAEFDREFLTRMIAHHEGALPMAEAEVADGENPQAQELARTIISTQEAEIAEMKGLLAQL